MNTWQYMKIPENALASDDQSQILVCESENGQSDHDISQCNKGAVLLITAPSGKRSLHCKLHAAQRFLGVPPELLEDGE